MTNIEDVWKKLPPDTRDSLGFIWEALPPGEKAALQSFLSGTPTDASLIRLLLNLSATQLKLAFGQKQQVAIVGPANVGKSTLYNQLIAHKEDRSAVSPVPGTTRKNQMADTGLFQVIDTPGADAVGNLGDAERQEALDAARRADFLVILFDAIQGIKLTEQDLFHDLQKMGKPYVVALNKTDLTRKDLSQVIENAAKNLGLPVDQLIPIAAKDGKNLKQLLLAIAVAEPQMVAALGRALPQYRWHLAWRTIVSAASISAVIALTPLPFIDFAPLVINQSVMVLGIARIYNFQISLERARELALTFGLGLLGRTLFTELSKLGGVPGWLLSVAIAASTTVVMGYAAAQWFDKGQRITQAELGELTRRVTRDLLNTLQGIWKRKPGKEALQDTIAHSLEEYTLPDE